MHLYRTVLSIKRLNFSRVSESMAPFKLLIAFVLLFFVAIQTKASTDSCIRLTATISSNNANQCLSGNSFVLTNNSSDTSLFTVSSHHWDYGDGNTSTTSAVSHGHSYATSGTFSVIYTVINSGGCKKIDTIVVNVIKVSPVFTVGKDSLCIGLSQFLFTNTSTTTLGTISNYEWRYGDGIIQVAANNSSKSHTYADTGLFEAELWAENSFGCQDSFTKFLYVKAVPNAQFTKNLSTACLDGNSFQFTNTSNSGYPVSNTSYSWSFGDGTTSVLATPANKTYSTSGSKTVRLIATNNYGCKDTVSQSVIVNGNPTANFTINDTAQCYDVHRFRFTNTSVSNVLTATMTYTWDFGDTSNASSTNPQKIYSYTGPKYVQLIARNAAACYDTVIKRIMVAPEPVSALSYSDTALCSNNNLFVFEDESTVESGGGSITASWNFGDATSATGDSVSRRYSTSGYKNVILTTTTSYDCEDTSSIRIHVLTIPNASYSKLNSDNCLSSTHQFRVRDLNASTIPSVNWTITGGITKTDSIFTQNFASSGTKNVVVIIQNSRGCADTTSTTEEIYKNPTTSIDVANDSIQCLNGNSFSLQSTSFSNVVSSSLTYNWSFGDASTSNLEDPSKSYLAYGTKNVQLIVTNNQNCKDTATTVLIVHAQPTVSFTINDSTQCQNNNDFDYTDNSTIPSGEGTLSRLWNLNGSATSVLNPVSNSFLTTGTKSVKLVITSSFGCADSLQKAIQVLAIPNGVFAKLTPDSCLNTLTVLRVRDLNSVTPSSVNWSFSDATTSTDSIVNKTFTTGGNKTGTVRVGNAAGCLDTVSFAFNLYANPDANFSIGDSTLCINANNFSFLDASAANNGSIVRRIWNYGDSDIDTLVASSTTHSYNSNGTYTVSLSVLNSLGCSDITTKSVYVYAQPLARFSIDDSLQCLAGNDFSFTSTSSSNASVPAMTFNWTFGDGSSSNNVSPDKTYSVTGAKTVTLIIENSNGCLDTVSKSVEIYKQPTSSFTVNDSAQCYDVHRFKFTSTSASNISNASLTYAWEFGDTTTASSNIPQKIYSFPGAKFVELIVRNNNGCYDTTIERIMVAPYPVASFTIDDDEQCDNDDDFLFTSTSSIASGGGTLSYNWDFGDWGTGTGSSIHHSYNGNGGRTVGLTVTSSYGCQHYASKSIKVLQMPNAMYAKLTSDSCANSMHQFGVRDLNAATFPAVSWTFTGGITRSDSIINVQFPTGGTKNIRVVVQNFNGCYDTINTSELIVNNPVASLTSTTSQDCFIDNQFSINGGSSDGSGRAITKYLWNLGDGTIDSSASSSFGVHQYAAAGNYTVKLITETSAGCKDTVIKNVYAIPSPTASFAVNDPIQCATGNSFHFSNNSNSNLGVNNLTYTWLLGDTTSTAAASPVKSYMYFGERYVSLTVTNDSGCTDEALDTLFIAPMPNSSFTFSPRVPAETCENYNLYNTVNNSSVVSGGGTLSYLWEFDKLNVSSHNSTLTQPDFSYTSAGWKKILLTTRTSYGCTDTMSSTTFVRPNPNVSISKLNTDSCISNALRLTVDDLNGDSIIRVKWDFQDGDTANTRITNKLYASTGAKSISAVVTNNYNCFDIGWFSTTLYSSPKAKFNLAQNTACLNGNEFELDDSSTSTFGTINSYSWSLGDGATRSKVLSDTVLHSYTYSDTFNAKLIVGTNKGCYDSVTRQIFVHPNPIANISIADSVQCFTGNQFNIQTSSVSNTSNASLSYSWNLGDTTTSTQEDPTKSYAVYGDRDIVLTVENIHGCQDTAYSNIVVHAMPVVNYSINDAEQCFSDNSFQYKDLSTIVSGQGTLSRSWTLGDGSSSTLTNVSKSYSSFDTLSVKMVSTSSFGCKDSLSKTVQIIQNPVAKLALDKTSNCFNGNVFTASTNSTAGSGSLVSYDWSNGDGNRDTFATASNNVIRYSDTGLYRVRLRVRNSNGCYDSISKMVFVKSSPQSIFSIVDSVQCLTNNTYVFTNTSTSNLPSSSLNYAWNYGDTTSAASLQPNKTYASAGRRMVRLIVSNDSGCYDTMNLGLFVSPMPVANFTINENSQCENNDLFIYKSTSSVRNDGGSISSSWNMADGKTSSSDSARANYQFDGSKTVKLVSTTSYGCSDSISKTVTVLAMPTTVFAKLNSDSCLNNNVMLRVRDQDASTMKSVKWTFSDTTNSTDSLVSKKFMYAGAKAINLVIENASGCYDTTNYNFNIYNNPVAMFTRSSAEDCRDGNKITLTDASSSSYGTLNYFKWTFGDGTNRTNVTNDTVQHSYLTTNTYSLRLVVGNNKGCYDSINNQVIINPNPIANISIADSVQCFTGNQFNIQTSSVSNTANASLSYSWNLGDTTTSTQEDPTKSYAVYGDRDIVLTVENIHGCQDTAYSNIVVHAMPVVNYSINDEEQCQNNNIFEFDDLTTVPSGEGSLTRKWYLGDATTDTSMNIVKHYNLVSTPTVKLVAFTSLGCIDSVSKSIEIIKIPSTEYTKLNPDSCLNTFVTLRARDNDVAKPYRVYWTFSDTTTSSDSIVAKKFDFPGTKQIQLALENVRGCFDTLNVSINLYTNPYANFAILDSGICINVNEFKFKDSTIVNNGSLTQLIWNYGDLSVDTLSTFTTSHRYSDTGTYTVKLRVTNTLGCGDTITYPVTVYPMPQSEFTIVDSLQCFTNNQFQLVNHSLSHSPISTLSYDWSFGDTTSSAMSQPSKTYMSDGQRDISLIVTNVHNCKDTFNSKLQVYSQPVPNFTINDFDQCENNNLYEFRDSSFVKAGGGYVYLNWSIGLGLTDTNSVVEHRYNKAAIHTIKLVNTTSYGCMDSIQKDIELYAKPNGLYTKLNSDSCLNNPSEYKVVDLSSPTMISVLWRFSDSTSFTDSIISKKFNYPGEKTIDLYVENDKHCFDTLQHKVRIYANPIAKYGQNSQSLCLNGNEFNFRDSSMAMNGSMTKYIWNYGNGTSEVASQNSDYVYPDTGNYSVRLFVENSLGCGDSIRRTLRVRPNPITKFGTDISLQCLHSNETVFTDSSISNQVDPNFQYAWDFGDTTYSSAKNPKKTYNSHGVRTVRLISTNAELCPDTAYHTIEIKPEPKTRFAINQPAQCVNNNAFTFDDTSYIAQVGGTYTVRWKFADGFTSTDTIVNRRILTPGLQLVRLVLTSQFNCQDSLDRTIRLYDKPKGEISYLSKDSCLSTSIRLKAINKIGTGVRSARWDFSDGTSLVGETVSKKFDTAGLKTIRLIVESNTSCYDTSTHTIRLYNNPKSNFSPSIFASCLSGNKFDFYDSAIANSGTMANIIWDFNDGVRTTLNPKVTASRSFQSARKYNVKHIAVNSYGCMDSSLVAVTVYANPTLDFDIDNSSQCFKNNLFTLTDNSLSNNSSSSMTYFWNFGDSTTSSAKNPTKSYMFDGAKTITLIASNNNGCLDTLVKVVNVRPQPVVKYGVNIDAQCVNNHSFNFSDSSVVKSGGGTLSRVWSFGDGTVSNSTNITAKKYVNPGNYSVKLTSTTSFQCSDTLVKIIKVLPRPIVSFTVNKDTQCFIGNSFEFYNGTSIASGGGTVSYLWNYGNAATSTASHPTYGYSQYGTYRVTLRATTQFGCIDSTNRNVSVIANPQVNFAFASLSKQCNSIDTFQFTNQTSALNGRGLSYVWNFGDGTRSTLSTAKKSYQNAGIYNVKLISTNTYGCRDSIVKTAQVYPDPKVDFAINQAGQCINNQLFNFTNNSTVDFGGGTLSHVWKYSDTTFANTANSSRMFANVKSYNIKLISTSSLGCQDSLVKVVTVYPKPSPDFDISDDQQCLQNNLFSFGNNSKISTGTMNYKWDFGDSTGLNTLSPNKSYSRFGNYNVKLVAISNRGCADSIVKPVKVFSQPLVNFLRSDTAMCIYQNQYIFNSTTTNGDGSALTYRWTYSDGTADTGLSAKKSFANSGYYLVKLIATSANACRDSSAKIVRIFPQPLASFKVIQSNQCLTNNSYSATNASSIATQGGSLSYIWDFGAGSTQTVTNPSWNYTAADTYTVALFVRSSLGCRDSLKKDVVVYPQPTVKFAVSDTQQCLKNNQFIFTNQTAVQYGSLTYQWSFGDGQTAVGQNPQIGYNTDGQYRVRLISRTNFGCSDSTFKTLNVYPDPTAGYNVNSLAQCANVNKFDFTNTSTVKSGTLAYNWNFGDARTSTAVSPSNKYTFFGTYNVKLNVATNRGCKDSMSRSVRVNPNPIADFVVNDSVQCLNGNDYIFTNNSSILDGKLTSFWDFGDAIFQSAEIGRHSYKTSKKYRVRLITSSAFLCRDTFESEIRVTNQPVVGFALNTNGMCERGNLIEATNQSTLNGPEPVNYVWKSTDGYTTSDTKFTRSFAESGLYELELIGVSSEGCSDSMTKNINIYPQGLSKMVVFDTIECLRGNKFNFGNDSRVESSKFAIMSWNFGDGLIDSVFNSAPVTYEYGDTGLFRVELISTTTESCQDTSFGFVRVVEMPEAVIAQSSLSYCFNDQQFEFYDITSTKTNSNNEWYIDKQSFNDIDTLPYLFTKPGKYNILLIRKTINGCSDTSSSLAIVNAIPDARISVNINEQCLEINSFEFKNISNSFSNPDEFWNFGDGALGTGSEIVQNYSAAGSYKVTLEVENDSACVDIDTMIVTVFPTPLAAITAPGVCVNYLSDIQSNASIESGVIDKYQWNLGDGKNSADSLPNHTYRKPGKYYISLAMTSDKGCFARVKDSTNIFANPIAGISVLTPRPTILESSISFQDSSENAAEYEWDFGDGSDLEFAFDPIHEYADSGDYLVQLVVKSNDGCYDTTFRQVRVWPDYNLLLPTAFSPNGDNTNDVYYLRGRHHAVKSVKWQIYTGEGIKVFESDKINDGWNGLLFNTGEPVPAGDYQLVVVIKDVFGEQTQFNEKISVIR